MRYEHGSCQSRAGVPLWLVAAVIGVVVLVAVVIFVVMIRSANINKICTNFYIQYVIAARLFLVVVCNSAF